MTFGFNTEIEKKTKKEFFLSALVLIFNKPTYLFTNHELNENEGKRHSKYKTKIFVQVSRTLVGINNILFD